MPERRKAKCVLADIETKAQWHRWPSEAKARAFLEATAKDRIRCFNTLMDAEEKAGFAKFCKVRARGGAERSERAGANNANARAQHTRTHAHTRRRSSMSRRAPRTRQG